MKVLITFNPVAGKGRAAVAAHAVSEHIDGHRLQDGRVIEVAVVETRLDPLEEWLTPHLESQDLLLILGGDGAVGMLARSALETGVPIFHYPTGTENLFSRDYGMRADPVHLLNAIEEGTVVETDVAEIDGTLMLLCASVGFDAEVVHDLASRRTGSISHLSYVMPLFRTLWRWRRLRSRVSIAVDDGAFSEPRHGVLIIANSRQYALRLDPAPEASTTDGALDVIFLPADTAFQLFLWAIRCRVGSHLAHPGVLFARGSGITVRCDPAARLQIDGDAIQPGIAFETLQARILDQKLRVLAPPSEKPSM